MVSDYCEHVDISKIYKMLQLFIYLNSISE